MRRERAVVVDGQHGSRRNALPVSCLPTNRKLTSTTDEATVSSPPILFPASFLQKRGPVQHDIGSAQGGVRFVVV